MHIYGSIGLITLIWVSLERSFPPAEVEYRWCQFWSKVITSEEEERPRFITGGTGINGLNNREGPSYLQKLGTYKRARSQLYKYT